jgi:hypothetical protein
MEKMTIHRALSELKLIDAKIEKQTVDIYPVGLYQKDKKIGSLHTPEEFAVSAQSKYDSVMGLIERKVAIKKAIVEANAKTKVKVAGKEMTIADAITYKAVVNFKSQLADSLRSKFLSAVGAMNKSNEQIEKNCQAILEATFGKESTKVSSGDLENVRKPYMDANEVRLFDPLKIQERIETIENEVEAFKTEVDAVLSEINATTFIEI